MRQSGHQVKVHLEQEKSELRSNIHELEAKAVSALDWKQHFEARPGMLLAAAFGGGLVLSSLLGGGRRRRRYNHAPPPSQPAAAFPRNENLWHKLKIGLVALASARVTEYVGRLIPGPRQF